LKKYPIGKGGDQSHGRVGLLTHKQVALEAGLSPLHSVLHKSFELFEIIGGEAIGLALTNEACLGALAADTTELLHHRELADLVQLTNKPSPI
jgi:hypothetical protein